MWKKIAKLLLVVAPLFLLGFIILLLESRHISDFELVCFDVRKGDAFLFTSEAGNVLIDTGYEDSGKEIVSYLEQNDIDCIDDLIITHFDKDHVGGAAYILNHIEVKQVFQPVYEKESKYVTNYENALEDNELVSQKITQDYTFSIGAVNYLINPPNQDDYDNDASNNSSLIISISYRNINLLFTGDAEEERLKEFLDTNPTTYTFLKVPYHGHYQSILPEFFDTIKPQYAVITSSDEEPEDEDTVDALDAIGCDVYYTRDGTITFQCNGNGIQVVK